MTLDLGDERGYLKVRFGGAAVDVDLLEANEKLIELHERLVKGPVEPYWDAVLDLAESLGLPRGSWDMAMRFRDGVWEKARELRKNSEGPRASADSTASTPAA